MCDRNLKKTPILPPSQDDEPRLGAEVDLLRARPAGMSWLLWPARSSLSVFFPSAVPIGMRADE